MPCEINFLKTTILQKKTKLEQKKTGLSIMSKFKKLPL